MAVCERCAGLADDAVASKVGPGDLRGVPEGRFRGPSKMRDSLISALFHSLDDSTMGACITVIYSH